MEAVDTLIIGAGQAGLVMSHELSKRGQRHVVVERGRIAKRWRSERWDGLHLQIPNLLVDLPGYPLAHDNPNGFATARQIAAFLKGYASFVAAPVRQGIAVTRPALTDTGGPYLLETTNGPLCAGNVVVATEPFQRPVVPLRSGPKFRDDLGGTHALPERQLAVPDFRLDTDQAQPNWRSEKSAFQILVMCPILSPSNCMT